MNTERAPGEQVFLSYSGRVDREASVALQVELERHGLTVFRYESSNRPGDQWQERLEEALARCSAFVLLVGRNGVQKWQAAEVQVALERYHASAESERRLLILPVLLEGVASESLPAFVRSAFHAVSWSATQPVPPVLVESIQTHTDRLQDERPIPAEPYVGLSSFQSHQADLFFGRQQETLTALGWFGDRRPADPEHMRGVGGSDYYRWLQIEGHSGAGKSSLVNAGMLPLIRRGWLWRRTGFENWRVIGPLLPGKDPVESLALALERSLVADETRRDSRALMDRLRADARTLAFRLKDFQDEETAFLLVVDQFEELFTIAEPDARKQFEALLTSALEDGQCHLFLLSTVRVDFLQSFEHLPQLQALSNSDRCKRYLLPAISPRGLREVIEGPARLARLDVREITDLILEDVSDEPGALPLVENALAYLWAHRQGDRMSGTLYRAEGRVVGMLCDQADKLLESLDAKARRGALELLLRLTRVNVDGRHTRQRITREEALMVAGGGSGKKHRQQGEQVLRVLSGERDADQPRRGEAILRLVVVSGENPSEQYVDLIHETLIRARRDASTAGKSIGYWPTLYDYVEKNRDRDLLRQQLELQTEHWAQARGPGRLARLAPFGWRRYRKLRIPKASQPGRFIAASRRFGRGIWMALLLFFIGVANKDDLGLWILTLRFAQGYVPEVKLVPVAPGRFTMGEQEASFIKYKGRLGDPYYGIPAKEFAIARGFDIGRTEVTYEQFDHYVWSEHRSGNYKVKYPDTAKGGRGEQPVVNIDWTEAMGYAEWFGKQHERACRLPTEIEWEYAARAGTHTAYPWGDDSGSDHANCANCGSEWDNKQAAPVARFQPNAWGLYDTQGNVLEWTATPWSDELTSAASVIATADDKGARVVRGGSWYDYADFARASARDHLDPSARSDGFGFRVLCLSPIVSR